jgi:hypothetical protein
MGGLFDKSRGGERMSDLSVVSTLVLVAGGDGTSIPKWRECCGTQNRA